MILFSEDSVAFNDHVERFLGRRLPPVLAEGIDFAGLASDARGVVLRLLALMKRSGCRATDITEQMIWLLGSVTPAMLPSAWGGRIPPLTAPGRHRKLDAYVARRLGPAGAERPVYIDLGCGFPPLTTVETAQALPDWTVFGVDLAFLEADLQALELPAARFVRCMNVLLYFARGKRETMLSAIHHLLEENGLLVTGFNHPFGIYARYTIYWKEGANFRPCEFAFGLDNLGPLGIGPWLTLADGDGEAGLLADLTAAIRRDHIFWSDFSDRPDALRARYDICRRDEHGFIRFTEETRSTAALFLQKKTAAVWAQLVAEGYTEGAVAALDRAGCTAWKNAVGDIAVLPPEGVLPAAAA